MPHMEPQIEYGQAWSCDTTAGITIIPLDVVGNLEGTPAEQWEALADYLEGEPMDADTPPELVSGYLARMSAPGYMDCTPWSVYATEAEAREALDDMYGLEDAPGGDDDD